jgi:hypothetical protein
MTEKSVSLFLYGLSIDVCILSFYALSLILTRCGRPPPHYKLPNNRHWRPCAGILEQSMGARNRVGIGLSYRPSQAGRIDSLETITGLLKNLKNTVSVPEF